MSATIAVPPVFLNFHMELSFHTKNQLSSYAKPTENHKLLFYKNIFKFNQRPYYEVISADSNLTDLQFVNIE